MTLAELNPSRERVPTVTGVPETRRETIVVMVKQLPVVGVLAAAAIGKKVYRCLVMLSAWQLEGAALFISVRLL